MNKKFLLFVPNAIRFLKEFSNLIYSILYTFLSTLLVPVVLFLIILVEIPRIELGILLFDSNKEHARLFSFVVIFVFLISSSLVFFIENQYGEFKKQKEWSLRIFIKSFFYKIGFSEIKYKDNAQKYRALASVSKWTTLILSIMGTMQPQIAAQGNLPWYEGLVNVLLNSNIQELSVWFSSGIATFFLISGTSGIAYFISYNAITYLNEIDKRVEKIKEEDYFKDLLSPKEFIQNVKIGKRSFAKIKYLQNDKFELSSDSTEARFYFSDTNQFTDFFSLNSNGVKALITNIIKSRSYQKEVTVEEVQSDVQEQTADN